MKKTPLRLCIFVALLIASIVYQLGQSSNTLPDEELSVAKVSESAMLPSTAASASYSDLKPKLRGSAFLTEILNQEDWHERVHYYREYLEILAPENALQMLAELEEVRSSAKRDC